MRDTINAFIKIRVEMIIIREIMKAIKIIKIIPQKLTKNCEHQNPSNVWHKVT